MYNIIVIRILCLTYPILIREGVYTVNSGVRCRFCPTYRTSCKTRSNFNNNPVIRNCSKTCNSDSFMKPKIEISYAISLPCYLSILLTLQHEYLFYESLINDNDCAVRYLSFANTNHAILL